ncbi:MAG: hypothetical protein AMXMBFR33_21870 [Candidatus Xenobia bacterium]
MSLRLLLDEDTQARRLVEILRLAGHDVLTVNEASLQGQPDAVVLERARAEKRVLLTNNCDDFRLLHESDPSHPGILAVFQDSDPSKNMAYEAVARALANLEASGLATACEFVVLNAWSF